MRPTLIFAALVAIALTGPAAAQQAPRQIVVTGSAQVETVPDLATITAGVETQADTAAEALRANSAAMTAVFAALESAAIAKRDVQTSQLNLSPVYDAASDGISGQKIIGYQASNMVTIRVRGIDRLGAVIDAATEAGANRLYGVAFEVSEPRASLDEARQRAVADAKAKAELFAAAAGVKLGSVLSLREGGGGGGPGPLFKAEMAAAPPVSGGPCC